MRNSRDNIDLVWNIAELSSLFERRTNVDGFLKEVVDRVASHLESDVCSIYLWEERLGALVLRATRGLAPESVGRVRLRLGEGITGTAVKELRPIREARAETSPHYKHIPEIEEESFSSFLAVPIRRGLNRIGALVVQHRARDRFTRQDVRALQAIAGQLAATLENAEVIMELHDGSGTADSPLRRHPETVSGKGAVEGIAVGRLVAIDSDAGEVDTCGSYDDHEAAFLAALERTDQQLEALQRELDKRIADIASLIFGAHLLMLRDDEFSGRMLELIRAGERAERAIKDVVDYYVALLGGSANPGTREKVHDVRDLGRRLLSNLGERTEESGDLRGAVVIAHELLPSELVKIAAQHAEGLVLSGGGATAHLSILARSLEIPTILLRDHSEELLREGDQVAMDAYTGTIHVNPSAATLERFIAATSRIDTRLASSRRGPARTADGTEIELLANVNILHDVEMALRTGAQGIGLYRSEFPFLVRADSPSEDEQYRIYRRIAERAGDGPLTLRTLDIGGDKVFADSHPEANPFLGLRGIRFSLAHEELFIDQLRAMLRAGAGKDLRILLPMISSVDELAQARKTIEQAIAQLCAEGLACNASPRVGCMIELPSAVECAPELARASDFLSIGSNDLVMYVLAVDRSNEHVESLYQASHPAVLRALNRLVTAARAAKCPISICGQAGADPAMLRFLVGIGVRSVSADPGRLPGIRAAAAKLNVRAAARFARTALALATAEETGRLFSQVP